jgi:hypothetical protein
MLVLIVAIVVASLLMVGLPAVDRVVVSRLSRRND